MPNSRFNTMISQHCLNFRSLFQELTKRMFAKTGGDTGYFHVGEFGSHRELVASVFLRPFTPSRYDIVNGFIIGDDDRDPPQCDILAIERDLAPFCTYRELGLFYPREAVAAVGEVKSRLDSSSFKKALEQVSKQTREFAESNVKRSGGRMAGPHDIWSEEFKTNGKKEANRASAPTNLRPLAFLICDRFEDDTASGSLALWCNACRIIKDVAQNSGSFSTPDAILSVQDGLLIRRHGDGKQEQEFQCISPGDKSSTHLKKFLSIYFSHLAEWTSCRVSFQHYFQVSEKDIVFNNQDLSEG